MLGPLFVYSIISLVCFLIINFKPLSMLCGSTIWFVSKMVRNPESRFFHNKAYLSA